MASIKTTIGGACTATGLALFGIPVTLSTIHATVPGPVLSTCIIVGVIMTIAGVFFTNLFAADKSEVVALLNRNNLNTTPMTPEEKKDTAPSPVDTTLPVGKV